MRVLPIMLVCSAVVGLTCEVQGGGIPEHPGILSTEIGTTADARGALATLEPASREADNAETESVFADGGAVLPGSASRDADAVSMEGAESAVSIQSEMPPTEMPAASRGLEPLVPSLRGRTFALEPGPRPFLHRLSFSPGIGKLGDEPLYVLRVAYNPNDWLGWEAHIGHNRGKSVHALFHMLNAQVRYPVPFRAQPYVTGGFGVVLVFPGTSINADPVTKNALAAGGGLELYLRDDLAVRGEWRQTSVFARDPYTDESTVYTYDELTFGLSFYRRIGDGS